MKAQIYHLKLPLTSFKHPILLLFAMLAGILLLSNPNPVSSDFDNPPAPGCVTVYEHIESDAHFGASQQFCEGTYDGSALGSWNGDISSFQVNNARITLYAHPGCFAPILGPFSSNVLNLDNESCNDGGSGYCNGSTWNDAASCIVVENTGGGGGGEADLVIDHLEVTRNDTSTLINPGASVPNDTSLNVEVHIKNIGDTVAEDFYLEYYDNGSDIDDDYESSAVDPGGNDIETESDSFTINGVGAHTLQVCLDTTSVISESNENNNCDTFPVNVVSAGPDWAAEAVGSVIFEDDVYIVGNGGQSSSITVQYKNVGNQTWSNSGSEPVVLSYRREDTDTGGHHNGEGWESAFRCSNWPSQNNYWADVVSPSTVSTNSTGSFTFSFCNNHNLDPGTYIEHFDIAHGGWWFNADGWNDRVTVHIHVQAPTPTSTPISPTATPPTHTPTPITPTPGTPPSGTLIWPPQNGYKVGDHALLRATAQDNSGSGIKYVRFNVTHQQSTVFSHRDDTPPYEYNFDMTGYDDGEYGIGLLVEDNNGQQYWMPLNEYRTIIKDSSYMAQWENQWVTTTDGQTIQPNGDYVPVEAGQEVLLNLQMLHVSATGPSWFNSGNNAVGLFEADEVVNDQSCASSPDTNDFDKFFGEDQTKIADMTEIQVDYGDIASFNAQMTVPEDLPSGQYEITLALAHGGEWILARDTGNRCDYLARAWFGFEVDNPNASCTVPYFSQRDSRWINHPLRTAGACGPECNTIGKCGCTLTSAAMVFDYYGASLTPNTLSDCMWKNACYFAWGTGASCSSGQAQWGARYSFSWNRLSQELNQNNRPVILGMSRGYNTHWVVVLSGSGNNSANYTIHDPYPVNGENMKLNSYDGWKRNWVSVYNGQSSCGNLTVNINELQLPESQKLLRPQDVEQKSRQRIVTTTQAQKLGSSSVITGSVNLYRMTHQTMTLQLDANSQQGDVTEMLIWTDGMDETTWQPFTSYVYLSVDEEIYARFRDSAGNVSETDDDTLYPRTSPPAVSGGTGTFIDSGQSLGSSDTQMVDVGDLDGDGDLDAFVANDGQANKVWLNDGMGIFSDSGQSLGSERSTGVALGDLDGDGDLDAFVSNHNYPAGQANEVWLNDGTGHFTDSGQSLGNLQSWSVALGDLDGDGDLDAFVTNGWNQELKIWLNDGTGNFSDGSAPKISHADSRSVALGDVDGDGDLDAFVAVENKWGNQVWLNDGTGNFSDSGQRLGGTHGMAVVLGDVDSDGDLDAFVGNGTTSNYPGTLWLNDGTGTFSFQQSLGSPFDHFFHAVALGDMDGDGDLDAFGGNYRGNLVNNVWLNDGTGTFSDSGQSLGSFETLAVALGDYDGDDDLDLFVANGVQGNIEPANKVWLNENPAPIDSVILALEPSTVTTGVGQTFDLPILVEADTLSVDGVSAYLNFEPTYLEVVSVTAGSDLPVELENGFDNASGQVNFSGGALIAPFPSGTFTLATVTFEALAETSESAIDFNTTFPRESNAVFDGTSLLNGTVGSTVIVHNAVLVGSVTLQGRSTPPSSDWIVPLNVSLTIPGESTPAYEFEPTTDENGSFTIVGVEPGTYEVRVKKSSALQNMQTVTLVGGSNNIDFGELREGDVNNDNFVSIVDFSLLAGSFAKCEGSSGFDERADFNGDGCVTILDFSLLASNFGQSGQSAPMTPNRASEVSLSDVAISIAPAQTSIEPGDVFNVTVRLDAGEQQVDGAQIGLNFDPDVLAVEEVVMGDKLALELANRVVSEGGSIQFAAGTLQEFPSGEIDVMAIQFRALKEGEAALAFSVDGAMASDVTFGGASVLGELADGVVVVSEPTAVRVIELAAPATAGWLWALAPLALTMLAGAWIVRR